ncbi:MAG: hypothetical protein R3208_11105 [Ketobacteraceae bacterium]|nr:hypothetical protein [Ketobacteraceae bacterium]
MSKVDVNDLVSILKFLDESFLREEQFSEICDLNANDVDDQRKIVQRVLVPGFNEMNYQTQEHLLNSVREIIDKRMDCSSVFERVNAPFDFFNINHLAFVEVIYDEICRNT